MKNVVDDFQFLAWIRVVVISLRNRKTEGGAVFGEKRSGPGELEMFMRHSCGSNWIYWYTYRSRVMIWAREKILS